MAQDTLKYSVVVAGEGTFSYESKADASAFAALLRKCGIQAYVESDRPDQRKDERR